MKPLPIGKRFGMLVLIRDLGTRFKTKTRFALFICDCGNIIERQYYNIALGSTKTCGCMTKQLRSNNNKKERGYTKYKIMVPDPERPVVILPNEPKYDYKPDVIKSNIWLIEHGLVSGALSSKWVSRMNQLARQII